MARSRERWVGIAATLVIALVVLDVVLLLATGDQATERFLWLCEAVLAVGLSVAATAIVRRQPDNRLALWFLLIAGGFGGYLFFSDLAEALWQLGATGLYPWVKLLGYTSAEVAWPLVWIIGQVYPDGRPLRHPLARGLWALSLTWVAANVVTTLLTEPLDPGWRTGNPLALGSIQDFMATRYPGTAITLSIFVGSLATLVVRYLRSHGAQRQQMKVFTIALATFAASIILPFGAAPDDIGVLDWRALVAGAGAAVIPVALGLAVLRWRLWEVDRLVSRTLGYLLTSGALLGAYVALITVLTRLVPVPDVVGIAAAVLAAATLFHPLRRRVQRLVDRTFNRTRIDADAVLVEFRARLLDAVDEQTVRDHLTATVATHLSPKRTGWWAAPG